VDVIALRAGLAALFLAVLVAVVTAVLATAGRTGPARALADIDRLYAPGGPTAAGGTLGDRAMRPILRLLTAIGGALTPRPAEAWVRRWLDYAGNPPNWPPERVRESQGLGLLTLGVLGGLVGVGLAVRDGSFSPWPVILGVLIGCVAGLWLPYAVVSHVAQKRQEEMRTRLPDALDMLTLSVEAGLAFDAALAQVAYGTRGALAGEIGRALQEMQMGKRRADAMRALAERTTVPELKTIAIAIVQATELGIPIAQVLREQAQIMRVRRRQHAEEKARKVPVKVLFPLIFCLFPALFIVILGPGILRIMDTLLR
jgi:tight adherence protein C